MSKNEYVRTEIADSIATVTIDRQAKLNALNPQVVAEVDVAFGALREDRAARAP